MKKYILLMMVAMLSVSCSGQNSKDTKENTKEKQESTVKLPKGDWKVNKEFDENGNLIRYDSIYSWSSNDKLNDLSLMDKDSLLKTFESKFLENFSQFENQGFEDIFSRDSLFSKQFFNDDFFGSSFGKDFMDIDKIRQQMIARQKKFLEKYQSEFIKPKEDN
ncbi:hypothetical protein [Pontimicrobium aquaticum]|uniref:Lipoprotein n=1 Tax=Pontimicrobium aquaticum TaxID=2565367 RepID=A0A4U0EY66_9FLAO|nr:hypothetical protein [Pontimicrobium aquaticum]TJY36344.1 hypothetical protein E5167_06670 [Pontimicrobium aquaticum]